MKQIFTYVFSLFLVLVLITACSPSSQSIRYGVEKETLKEDIDSSVRFTSQNDSLVTDLLFLDTLGCEVEDSELDDPDDIPEDESIIDISSIMNRLSTNSGETSLSAEQNTYRDRMIMEIIKYMNTPYKFGGNSMRGIDCSAFTQTVYRDALSININRSAREQYKQGEVIEDKTELKFGDLVFFNTRRRVRPGHVGIYIGDNLFAHASTKHGVTVSSLDHNYYSARYMGARRIDNNEVF